MNITELIQLVDGSPLTQSGDYTRPVKGAFAADLMSDVLATIKPEAVLVTGLCNPQVIRTAHMADVAAILLVRGKTPAAETLSLAEEEGIPFISTPYGMYEVCGRIHHAGVPSLETQAPIDDCSSDY